MTTARKDSRPAIPGLGISIFFLVIFMGISGTFGIVGGVLVAAMGKEQAGPFIAILSGVGNLVATAALLLIGKAWSRRSFGELLPFKGFSPLLMIAILFVGMGFSALMSEADNLLRYVMPMPEWLGKMMMELTQNGPASFFVLVIVAPLTEEALFRGIIMNGFLKRYSPTKAVVLSALLFSLFHLNPYQMANAFVLGLVLGWLRLRTGSLWPPIILHALSNGLVFITALLPVQIPGYTPTGVHSFQPWWMDAGGAVLAAGGLVLMRGLLRKELSSRTEIS